MLLTHDQFKETFLPLIQAGCAVYRSPHLSYMVKYSDVGNSTSTIIADLLEYDNNMVEEIASALPSGGVLYARVLSRFILKLQKKKFSKLFNFRQIHIDGEHAFIEAVKEDTEGKTTVHWGNTSREVDFVEDIITANYDEDVYAFIDAVDLKKSYRRITIDGKGLTADEQLAIRGDNPNPELCLFVRNAGNGPKVEMFEDVAGRNIGGDFFVMPNKKTRNRFLSVFRNPLILNFIAQVSYNKYDSMRLSHKEYIFNPHTLTLL